MRVLAWNLNHRAARQPIPHWVNEAIAAEHADAVLLTEYVVGPDHHRFERELKAAGFGQPEITSPVKRENQLLIAAREPIVRGELKPSNLHRSVPPNFLHVRLAESGLDLVGFRMPAYEDDDRRMKRPRECPGGC